MNFIVPIEIFCFAINFQLIKSNETDVTHDTEITTEELSTQFDHNPVEQPEPLLLTIDASDPTTEASEQKTHAPETTTDFPEPLDHYTFVVLIEIMFNDGSRQNCTGTIIHDSVVITAAHCFEKEFLNSVEPELTGSFVIIGTKDMFDSGYEKYLPIERVLIHPDYKGWNADLALIYTFAGMMSDKPGDIIPLATENSFTPLYNNVTVLQWNQIKQKNNVGNTRVPLVEFGCSHSSEDEVTYFDKQVTDATFSSGDLSKEISKEPSDEKSNTAEPLSKESKLIMEEYTIFERDSCINLIRKLKPELYNIESGNKTICFFTRYSNKIQASSGALVVHRNRLVAIAAGDIDHNSKHIIIATKLNCYCKWIRENLPSGGEKLRCCTDCCPEMGLENKQEIY